MAKLELKKNKELVLTKDGDLVDEFYIFENISYDPKNLVLVREDDNFKFFLDFKNNVSQVTIKAQDYTLDLKINTTKVKQGNKKHEIYYNIESEEVIENQIIVTF